MIGTEILCEAMAGSMMLEVQIQVCGWEPSPRSVSQVSVQAHVSGNSVLSAPIRTGVQIVVKEIFIRDLPELTEEIADQLYPGAKTITEVSVPACLT